MSGHKARIHSRNVFVCFKPLLIYVKGKKRSCDTPFADLVTTSKAPNKVLHPFEESVEEAEYFIGRLSYEGQIVCDPMLGTGTTGLASLKSKRRFIGIEKEASTLKAARAKIARWIKDNP